MNKATKEIKLDIEKIRNDFPILEREINGKKLVYFDNAATTQKPNSVIDEIADFYRNSNANIHRAVHELSKISTKKYEEARKTVQNFINAKHYEEILFTKGATEAINLVADRWGDANLKRGDEVLISEMEHHSNIIPWQLACEKTGAELKVAPINDEGELIMEEFDKLLSEKTKIVAVTHISNSLGTVNPVEEIIEKAHKNGALILIDGAQSIQHKKIDVQKLDCDFYAFSGHKVYGPTGIGVLYGKKKLLEETPPYQGGGDMIMSVTFEKTTFNNLPYKFEAGTQNIAGIIGLAKALEYVEEIGLENIDKYEREILDYATKKVKEVEGLKIIGTAKEKASVISFIVEDVHPNDIGIALDIYGIAIRTGHHCTEPIMNKYNIPGTARLSLAFYNTKEEIDYFVVSLNKAIKMLK